MITKLHISSFIGLTIFVWLIVLWFQGQPVLSLKFLAPFGIVVSVISLIVLLFNKYIWAWKIFNGWYVKRPDIRGTWLVELQSNWIEPTTNEVIPPIKAFIVVRQTLTSLSFRLMTKESKSRSIAYNIEVQEEDTLFKLVGIYRNEPNINLQGLRSDIHYGSFSLDIHGNPVDELEGFYWTDRGTKGTMKLLKRNSEFYNTFDEAEKKFK